MTRNKKIVKPNITYVGFQQTNYSGQYTPNIILNNLGKAKKALQKLNNPKLSNLEKAKRALYVEKNKLVSGFYSTPSGKNSFYKIYEDLYKDANFKVTVNSEKNLEKAKVLQELINYVTSGKAQLQKHDKNTNKSRNS